MGLPILDEIFAGIRWIIDFFFNKIPRPVQYLLFLMFLLVFSVLISFSIHLFGVHCDHDGDVVRTSPLQIATNIRIAFQDPLEQTNTTSFQPENIGFLIPLESCKKPICHDYDEFFNWAVDSECDNKTTLNAYLTKQFDWGKCVVCLGDENYSVIQSSFGLSETETLCFGDAYRINRTDMNFVQRMFCDPDSRCMPPVSYYYDYSTGLYTCLPEYEDFCGINATQDEVVWTIDEELKEAGAEAIYSDTDMDYRKAIYFKCDASRNPELTFFGIPFLDYKVWLLLFVLIVMFVFLAKIKKH